VATGWRDRLPRRDLEAWQRGLEALAEPGPLRPAW
jgi:hypothetical protein